MILLVMTITSSGQDLPGFLRRAVHLVLIYVSPEKETIKRISTLTTFLLEEQNQHALHKYMPHDRFTCKPHPKLITLTSNYTAAIGLT